MGGDQIDRGYVLLAGGGGGCYNGYILMYVSTVKGYIWLTQLLTWRY